MEKRGSLKKPKPRNCIVCGKVFMQIWAHEKMCSNFCKREREREHWREKGDGGTMNFNVKKDLVNPKCIVCGYVGPISKTCLHGHHMVPHSWGGENTKENIIILCPNHHAIAHAMCNGRKSQQFIDNVLCDKHTLVANIISYESDPRKWLMDYHRTLINSVRCSG